MSITTLLRRATRLIASQPRVVLGVALPLAVGLTVYGFMGAVVAARILVRPAGVRDADELRRVHVRVAHRGDDRVAADEGLISPPDLALLERDERLRGRVAGYLTTSATTGPGGVAQTRRVSLVSPGYFAVVRPAFAAGRAPLDDASAPAAEAIVVSARWTSPGGGDALLPARGATVNGMQFATAGVTVADFRGVGDVPVDAWLPIAAAPLVYSSRAWLDDTSARQVSVVVRARTRSELEELLARMHTVLARVHEGVTVRIDAVPIAYPEQASGAAAFRRGVATALALTALVLAIVVANVISLLGVRLLAVRHEIACRVALGASRLHIMEHLLFELAVVTAVACLAAVPTIALARSVAGQWDPVVQDAFASWRVWGSLLACLAVGAPALALFGVRLASRLDIVASLRHGARTVAQGVGSPRLVLLGIQQGAGLLIMVAAALAAAHAWRHRNPVPRQLHALVAAQATLYPAGERGTAPARVAQARREAGLLATSGIATLERLPFVDRVAASSDDIGRASTRVPIAPAGRPGMAYDWTFVEQRLVTPGFFPLFGLPVVRGTVPPRAASAGAVLVNPAFTRMMLASSDPLAQCVRMRVHGVAACLIITGVVDDSPLGMLGGDGPRIYRVIPDAEETTDLTLYLRPKGDRRFTSGELATIQSVIAQHAPALISLQVHRVGDELERRAVERRRLAITMGFVALLAMGVALGGVLAVTLEITAARRREAAIRSTLGATAMRLAWWVCTPVLLTWAGAVAAASLLVAFVGPRADGGSSGPEIAATLVTCVVAQLGTTLLCLAPAALAVARAEPASILRTE